MSFSFQLKPKKKTPFQRQKELEEEKRKRDDEEAAKVYEEFVKDFGGADDNEPGKKAFVRGGVVQPGVPPSASAPTPPAERLGAKRHYVPSFVPPGLQQQHHQQQGGSAEPESVFQSAPSSSAKNKPRRIDALLENMKRDQAEREQRRERGLPPDPIAAERPVGAAHDATDQGSTNLFVGNLAHDVDEGVLMREFGRFGPIASVKIMWPRDEEQRRRGRNNGFVAFMRREDAERARDGMDGVFLRDLPLSVGWSKSVALPAVPVWPPPAGVAAPAAGPESSRQRPQDGPPPRPRVLGRGPDVSVAPPADPRQRFVIDATAFYVARDGCDFEQAVMARETSNPEFAFLFDTSSAEHAYYRWRVFSLANGDSLRSWRTDPFVMVGASNRWIPPPMTAVGPAPKGGEEPRLPAAARDRLAHVLHTLTVDRQAICDAMVMVLDHADCAEEVTDALVAAASDAAAPAPARVARLFLLSDVLHNTSAGVRNVSRYRSRLQDALPDIFESLAEACRGADGSRMAAEALRRHVLKVLRVWRGWYIFTDDYLNGLQARFLQLQKRRDDVETSEDDLATGNPVLAAALAKMTDDELEIKCKHSGVSRCGGREAQVRRLLAVDAYINGGGGNGGGGASGSKPLTTSAAGASGWEDVPAAAAEEEERRKRTRAADGGGGTGEEGQGAVLGQQDPPMSQDAAQKRQKM